MRKNAALAFDPAAFLGTLVARLLPSVIQTEAGINAKLIATLR
jgi:hypothetical protein